MARKSFLLVALLGALCFAGKNWKGLAGTAAAC